MVIMLAELPVHPLRKVIFCTFSFLVSACLWHVIPIGGGCGFGSGSSLLGWLLWIGSVSATEKLAFGCSHCCGEQGCAETFGGAGAQSIKGAHGARLLIGLCSLLICVSKWMLLYWYSSKCHDAGLKKKHRTEKTISSLNVKDIFLHLNYSGMILLLLFLLLLLLLCLQGMVVLLL